LTDSGTESDVSGHTSQVRGGIDEAQSVLNPNQTKLTLPNCPKKQASAIRPLTLPTPLYVVYREIVLVPVIDFFSVYRFLGAGDTEVTGSEIHCPSKARCVCAYSDFSAALSDSSWASSALR